jgi:hypothetical protein
MIKEVLVAKWLNTEKTQILARTKDENGTITDKMYNYGDADYTTLLDIHSVDEINRVTEEQDGTKIAEPPTPELRAKSEAQSLEKKRQNQTQKLFESKIEAFEIVEIRNSSNRILRSKLRKAARIIEVTAISALIIQEAVLAEEKKTKALSKKSKSKSK